MIDDDTNEENWVIPIPTASRPQFAILPWETYQQLVRQSGVTMRLAENLPQTADAGLPDNVERLPYAQRPGRPNRDDFENDGSDTGNVERPALNIWGAEDDSYNGYGETAEEDAFPIDVMERLMDGEHPVKVFRRYRGLTQKELADLTGLNPTYLSQIETRKRGGSTRVYRRLAAALSIDIGNLID